jgi:hypothetical protein
MAKVKWTPEKDQRLAELIETHTHRQIGVILGHTAGAVASRCQLLGLQTKVGRAPNFEWTPELDAVVVKATDEELTRIAPLLNQRLAALRARQDVLKFGPVVTAIKKQSGPASVFHWGQQ